MQPRVLFVAGPFQTENLSNYSERFESLQLTFSPRDLTPPALSDNFSFFLLFIQI